MWQPRWRAVNARIQALVEAGAFFLRSIDSEYHNASDLLIANARSTVEEIDAFGKDFDLALDQGQRQCLSRFVERYRKDLIPATGNGPSGFSGVTSVLTYLASFRAEFEYLSMNNAAIVRSLVVRAFSHLQRTIVVDEVARDLWNRKFEKGEIACEALGSCHLLSHGIWAFKTSATGERTDLVLGEHLDVSSEEVQRASVGLILTEWKVVRNASELPNKLEDAYQQATRYRVGILAGFEVASPRYLIIVSKDYLELPPPRQENNVVYEYRNIAVSPSTPSKIARRTATAASIPAADDPAGP
jgi:hypothetical protein